MLFGKIFYMIHSTISVCFLRDTIRKHQRTLEFQLNPHFFVFNPAFSYYNYSHNVKKVWKIHQREIFFFRISAWLHRSGFQDLILLSDA